MEQIKRNSFKQAISSANQLQFSMEDLQDFIDEQKTRQQMKRTKSIYDLISPRKLDIMKVILTRAIWTLNILTFVAFVVCVSRSYTFLLSILIILFMWLETVYICVRNKAKDFYW